MTMGASTNESQLPKVFNTTDTATCGPQSSTRVEKKGEVVEGNIMIHALGVTEPTADKSLGSTTNSLEWSNCRKGIRAANEV
jgi:hypothetical protein